MSKLWIIHRLPRRRDALAHLSGLASPDLVCGGPNDADFADAAPPAAVLIGLEGDFELELDFLHRHRNALAGSRRFLLTTPEDVDEVRRLFGAAHHEILDHVPSERSLRALVLSAVSHRNAEPLAERRDRERIAQRFSRWFGDLEIPGLLRALDPSLGALPLLVRGVPGSGRSLLARYVELFRGRAGPVLRIDAREIAHIDDLAARLRSRTDAGLSAARTIWIDEVDACSPAVQRALAEWVRLDAAPVEAVGSPLRWVATAGPRGLHDSLEAGLERAFAPLDLSVPPIVDDPEALARFAERVATEWTATVGGVPRSVPDSAFAALEAQAWTGDRAAVEAALRSTFVSSADAVSQGPAGSLSEDALTSTASPPRARSQARAATRSEKRMAFDEEAPRGAAADAIEDASFLDETFPEPPAQDPDSIEDFERAFLEGLSAGPAQPQAENAGGTASSPAETDPPGPVRDLDAVLGDAAPPEPPRPSRETPSPNLDPSTQFSEESFEIARTGVVDPTPTAGAERGRNGWRRLARSLSHEIRNPLVSIRTFTELLPEHFGDASFRERFTELVGRDVAHIDEVVSRLADAAASEKLEAAPVDVSALLERLLDARRDRIAQGRLLVLRELERDSPIAWADPHALEVALAGLLDRALAALPERGDLFVATRRIERAADGTPRLRVLLRHHNPELGASEGGPSELSSAANVLEYVLAETVVEASGGTLTIDSTDAHESLILVDLRTPS